MAVDAEVLNDFEGCYSVQLGPLFPKDESRFEPYSIGECGQRICIHDDRVFYIKYSLYKNGFLPVLLVVKNRLVSFFQKPGFVSKSVEKGGPH